MDGTDRDLLFSVLAVQVGFVTPVQMLSAASAWAMDRSRGIAERLQDSGAIPPDKVRTLEAMLDHALEADGGDLEKSLATVGGAGAGLASFGGAGTMHEKPGSSSEEGVTPEADGRYAGERDAELGRGGMGRVLLAFDRHLERTVAMKELLVEEDPYSQRFLQEARVTGQLEHPGIVPVHELGRRPDGSLYYTMKVVRGRTLKAAITAGGDVAGRLKLLTHFRDLCQTLAYAHDQGVVHRDLKPDNVMVGEFGETVLLDWGLAKVQDRPDLTSNELQRSVIAFRGDETTSGSGTIDGASLGTPAYMSPEQAEGDVARMDERSDVWGLGAVLFEILTGQPPFTAPTPMETIGKVLVAPVPKVRAIAPEAPAELADIAEKALQRDRAGRYTDAKALAAEMEAYLGGGRVGAHAYSTMELIGRVVRRHKIATAALALLTLGTVVFSVGSFLLFRRAETARGVAVSAEQRARASAREARARLADSYVDKAQTLYRDRQFGPAAIYAAAAAERSPFLDPADTSTRALRARVELRSLLFASRGFRQLDFARTLPSPSGPRGFGTERTRTVRFLRSGSLLAAAESKGWIAEPPFDARRTLQLPPSNFYLWVEAFASPDESRWSVGARNTLGLVDLEGGEPPRTLRGLDSVRGAFFDGGRKLLLHFRENGRWQVQLHDATSLAPLGERYPIPDLGWCLVPLDDRRVLLSKLSEPVLLTLDALTGRVERKQRAPLEGKVQVIQLSSARDLVMIYTDRAHFLSWPALEPRWSADPALVPVILDDGRVFFEEGGTWSLREASTGAVIERSPTPRVVWPAASSNGRQLALAPRSGDFQLWTVGAPIIETVDAEQKGLASADVSADGRMVAFAGDKGVTVFDRSEGRMIFAQRAPRESLTRVAFAPRDHRLAVVMGRQQVYVVDLDQAKPSLRELTAGPADYAHYFNGLAWTANGEHVLVASPKPWLSSASMYAADGSGLVRRVDTGLATETAALAALATDPSGRWLAASVRNQPQVILRLSDGRRMLEVPERTPFSDLGAFSADGGLYATGLESGDTLVYTLPEGELVSRLPGEGVAVDAVAISADGAWLAVRHQSRDLETVKLWHRPSGQLYMKLPGAGWGVLRFLSERTIFATGDGFAHFIPIPDDPLAESPAELSRQAEEATPYRIPE